jgi:hypothetical protein
MFYDENNKFIPPSDITLNNNLHILCNSKEINSHIKIISLADIYRNKYFKCTEFFNKNDEVLLGIKIYKIENGIQIKTINFIIYKKNIYYRFITKNAFNCSQVNEEYYKLYKAIHNNKSKESHIYKLKQAYIQKPTCLLKKNVPLKRKNWIFSNIFNNYFCFCKGPSCHFETIPQHCKYFFYLNIIDNNKNIYNKTEYLFGDFIYNQYSSDDTFPIFSEMIKKKLPAHYITENMKIYMKYCKFSQKCLKIILTTKEEKFIINGDFLEKYLTLILKLKAVATGSELPSINNIFFNIDYITYISIGHGVSFFKHFLYNRTNYYGNEIYNKILIPPSEKFISIPKFYGWKDEDIIKINLPRWDKYYYIGS